MRIIFILVINIVYLFAQALNMNQAVEILKNQNLEIKMAELDVQSSEMSIDMANAQHYGQLNFVQNISRSDDAGNVFGFKLSSREANFGDFGADEFMAGVGAGNPDYSTPPDALNYPDSRNYFQSKLVYELPLYTGNKITAYTQMAKEMKRISTLDKQKQLQEKLYELRKSYYDMALLENSLKNLNLILHNIQKLEKTTQSMIDEGYAKKVDILEVKSKKANVKRFITELEANEELLYHYLSFLLNQDVNDIVVPTYDLSAPNITAQEILERSIDIKKAQTALNIYKSMLTVEKSRYLPTVGAIAEVQTADNNFLSDANDHKSYTVGIQLTWNIFSGGGDSAAIEQAQINRLKSQTQAELAKKGIALKIKEIQTNITQADSKIKNLSIELDLAEQIYENYEGRYKEKLISMNDVIIKQSSWLQKVLETLKAKNDRNRQIFALEKLALIMGDE